MIAKRTYADVLVVQSSLSSSGRASVVKLDAVGLDVGNGTRIRMHCFDFTILAEYVFDQWNDIVSSQSGVLRIEQDLNFELALVVADGAERPIQTEVSSDLEAECLGVYVADGPVTLANVLESLDCITNVGERDKESLYAGFATTDDTTEGWVGSGLDSK